MNLIRASSDPAIREERKHADLLAMMLKYWRKNGLVGPDRFIPEKFWAYGCHCVLLGSNPITEVGVGVPRDEMDNTCRIFKECHRCVKAEFGDGCNGELRKYAWKWDSKDRQFYTRNDAGSVVGNFNLKLSNILRHMGNIGLFYTQFCHEVLKMIK